MTSQTPRLSLPYILSNQSQKEVTHNEALNALDGWVMPVLEDHTLSTPPAEPGEGQLWVVAAGATDAWLGEDGRIAQWLGGAWKFHAPFEGLRAWLKSAGAELRFDGLSWQEGVITGNEVRIAGLKVVGSRQMAIADPAGGATVDAESRTAIGEILTALRSHGLIVN